MDMFYPYDIESMIVLYEKKPVIKIWNPSHNIFHSFDQQDLTVIGLLKLVVFNQVRISLLD